MLSQSAIAGMWFTLFVCFMVPILAITVLALRNRKKGVLGAWFMGMLGFFIAQIMLRIPVLNYMSDIGVLARMQKSSIIGYCLFLALTAAFMETVGRFAAAKVLEKRGLSFQRSLASGMGHGAIEAMLVVGLTYISDMTYVVMIMNGSFDTMVQDALASGIATEADAAALMNAKDILVSTNGFTFALAGYERILTMILHVFMTVLLCFFVIKKQSLKGHAFCFIFHSCIDFVTAYVGILSTEDGGDVLSQNAGYAIIYIFLTIICAGAVYACIRLKRIWDETRKQQANAS